MTSSDVASGDYIQLWPGSRIFQVAATREVVRRNRLLWWRPPRRVTGFFGKCCYELSTGPTFPLSRYTSPLVFHRVEGKEASREYLLFTDDDPNAEYHQNLGRYLPTKGRSFALEDLSRLDGRCACELFSCWDTRDADGRAIWTADDGRNLYFL